ncbi:MAG: tol-pal system protein YbgF [Myxococcales bacterium]
MLQGRSFQRGGRRARGAAGLLALLCLGSSCAGRAARVEAAGVSTTDQTELANLRAQLAERDRRLNQLESRLSLLEASQRELRYAVAEGAREPVRESVTIGEREASSAASKSGGHSRPSRSHADAPREEQRPMLRLYEEHSSRAAPLAASDEGDSPAFSSAPVRAPLMPVPQVSERLPVAPVPSLGSVAQVQASPAPDPGELYRRAIDLVRQRDFPQALRTLDEFLTHFTADARAAKAMFWRGEVLFAQREYGAALSAYQGSLSREPHGEKAPDALLKLGLCHRHLGASERAQEAMQRLRTQFPESAAARLLSEEDA